MTRGHGLETIVDLVLVASADAAIEHDLPISVCHVTIRTTGFVAVVVGADGCEDVLGDHGLADGEKVRAETADEPLDEDLEDSCGDERVQEANGCVVDVPEAASADLDNQEDGKRDEEGHQRGSPDGYNLVAERVRELGIDDLAILEDDYERLAVCFDRSQKVGRTYWGSYGLVPDQPCRHQDQWHP